VLALAACLFAPLPSVCCVVTLQESNEVFDVLEGALQSHPYFKSQAAAAAAAAGASAAAAPASTVVSPHAGTPQRDSQQQQQQQDEGPSTAAGASGGAAAAAGSSDDSGVVAGAGEDGSGPGLAVVNTATMLTAVRKDRTTFMDQVNDTVQRATPNSPAGGRHAVAGCCLCCALFVWMLFGTWRLRGFWQPWDTVSNQSLFGIVL
jgi:hypothetical protein